MEKEAVHAYYQTNMYGTWRSGEKVTFEPAGEDLQVQKKDVGGNLFEAAGGKLVRIKVEKDDRRTEFVVSAFLPEKKAMDRYLKGSPFLICMHPVRCFERALSEGYALFFMDSIRIASDDTRHQGAFYDLYPYGEKGEDQTGVLMAWAWGVSKLLDAVYSGLGDLLCLDPDASMVTGVSRWGKASAICGAFDQRICMTIPVCSGAGGLALFNYVSEGKTYDFTKIGGPQAYTYTKNEPLENLQSETLRGWFNDRFLRYTSPSEFPMDQDQLPVLAMSGKRYYFIIAACMGEDWINAPAMWECYKKANEVYAAEGLEDHLAVHFHKEGHDVIDEDMDLIVRYFNFMYFGFDMGIEPAELKTTVFAEN